MAPPRRALMVVQAAAMLSVGLALLGLRFAGVLDGGTRSLTVPAALFVVYGAATLVFALRPAPDLPLPSESESEPAPVRRTPRHVRLTLYGMGAAFAAAMTVASSLLAGFGPLLLYAALLAVAAAVLFTLAVVHRLRDGPAAPGPVEEPVDLRPGAGMMRFASPWAPATGMLVSFGVIMATFAVGYAGSPDNSWTIWPVAALAAGALVAAIGLTALVRDQQRLGHAPLPPLLIGFGVGLLSWTLFVGPIVAAGTGAGLRGLLRSSPAFAWTVAAGLVLALVGVWLHVRRQAALEDPEDPTPRKSPLHVVGFLLTIPVLALVLASLSSGGTPGSHCIQVPTESPNGGLNATVQFPAGDALGPLLGTPASGSTEFDATDGTSFILVRAIDGVAVRVERFADGTWAPVAGGDVHDGFHRFGRGDYGDARLRLVATAGPDRAGTAQPVELLFHSEPFVESCTPA